MRLARDTGFPRQLAGVPVRRLADEEVRDGKRNANGEESVVHAANVAAPRDAGELSR